MSHSRNIAAVIGLVILAFLVGACGPSGPSTVADHTPTTPASAAPSVSPPSAMPASPSSTSPNSSASTTPPSAAASASTPTSPSSTATTADIDLSGSSLAGITNPGGTIACLFSTGPVSARCDVQGAHWKATPPAQCPGVYGDSATLGPSRSTLTCHGDTVFGGPNQVQLARGQTVRYRTILCTVHAAAITCRNADHGFTVSQISYTLF